MQVMLKIWNYQQLYMSEESVKIKLENQWKLSLENYLRENKKIYTFGKIALKG